MSAFGLDWRVVGRSIAAVLTLLGLMGNLPPARAEVVHGARLVKDIHAGPDTSYVMIIGSLDDAVYLGADDGIHGHELWKTDGTEASTTLVADILTGPDGSGATGIGRLHNEFFFIAFSRQGLRLWSVRSDDSIWLLDVFPESGTLPCVGPAGPALGSLLLTAMKRGTGCEPWRTDGTVEGTAMLLDIEPGPRGSDVRRGVEFGGMYFFPAYTTKFAQEMWRTDGTPQGTRIVADIAPGPWSSYPGDLTVFNGSLYFGATDTTSSPWRAAVWRIRDGSVPPQVALELQRSGGIVAATSMMYLGAENGGEQGFELWRSDGTPAGTRMVRDICAGPCSSIALSTSARWKTLGDTVFFPATDTEGAAPRLWASDGTAVTTRVIGGPTDPELLTVAGDRIVFSAVTESEGRELWVSDGSAAGTFLVRDIALGSASSDPAGFFVHGDQLFFSADDGVVGRELWMVPLTDLREPPPASPTPTATPSPLPTATPLPACAGDCDGNRMVTVEEVVRAVNIALGVSAVEQCRGADTDGSAAVEVAELVQAVRNALDGCR